MKRNIDIGLLILRLALGVLMLFHGIAKVIHGLSGIEGLLESKGLPEFLSYAVYIGEIMVPLLIIVGYRTRLASVVYVVNVLFAMLLAHANVIFSLSKTGGWAVELIGLYLFGSFALFFTGAGKYAISTNHKWD